MGETYLLRGARQLLTLRGPSEVRRGFPLNDLSIISDGALLIRGGRIEEVGMTRRVENLAAAKKATVIDATGRAVMPAFVDPFVSLVFAHHGTEGNDARLKSGVSQTAASHRDDILDAARRLIDQGGAVALASGFNPDQCPTYSMPFVIAMACRYLGMSAAEAISAATVNAAHALRCAEHTGSLESGKQADILILNARDYRELPLTPGVSLVHTMIKSGRVAYQEGKC